jgi:hypothetical protein
MTATIAMSTTPFTLAATSVTPASTSVAQASTPDFGNPPSGQIPILFNDQHVYTKPDTLKQGRVLAALVRNGTILLPLRGMFEQTGATVSYDPSTKTADVSKPGADVKVTVGKPEVVINGESRPLDVAPIWYKGDILVPVRVIAEGMGAYVQWVPDKQVVVVRYLPPTPPPTPEPTQAPTVAPTVVPTATPMPVVKQNPLHIGGYVRSYDFYRDNAYSAFGGPGPSAKANQNTWSNALSLHADYTFGDSGFNVGASYLYAVPFQCANKSSENPVELSNPCSQSPPSVSKTVYTNTVYPDATLPGYSMSALYEAYLQYNKNGLYFKGGDQVVNTPWAPASDSRLKPDSFQGADLSYKLGSNWIIEGSDYLRWMCRTCTTFDQGTLLTTLNEVAPYPTYVGYSGANAYPSYFYDPLHHTYTNNGFVYGRLGYIASKDIPLTANLYYYGFENIANAFWADAKWQFAGPIKPYIAVQGGTESNAGADLLGTISSTIYGAQVGFNPLKDILISVGYNDIPWKDTLITVPTTAAGKPQFTCSATSHQVSAASSYGEPGESGNGLGYLLPASGTAECSPGPTADQMYIYYGGWASPYTESYASDPTFTASGTQSMIDRQSGGQAVKAMVTFTSDDKQLVASFAQTWYDYNNPGYAQATNASDVDVQYFFSHIPKSGPYKGFSLRTRLFTRAETNFLGASVPGLFKYSRFQAEYDF